MKALLIVVALLLAACAGAEYSTLDEAIKGEDCTVEAHNHPILSTDEVYCSDGKIISWHETEYDREAHAQIITSLISVERTDHGEFYNIYETR